MTDIVYTRNLLLLTLITCCPVIGSASELREKDKKKIRAGQI